jgi:CBS domain-containing protein
MNLLKCARAPALTVTPDTTVLAAIEKMVEVGVGAVAVVEGGKLVGIFTERDVIQRVAVKKLPMDETAISEVMSSPVETARPDTNPSEVLSIMDSKHIRHLPIVDEDNRIQGMLSIRHLLHHMVEDLSQELHALDSYMCADGPGG